MNAAILYVHGKGGSAAECEHYRPLFPGCAVFGLDYKTFTPWEAGPEIRNAAEKLKSEYDHIRLIANSIGAFFSMSAEIDRIIDQAYFISPIVDMEKLICEMMRWANVTETELKAKGVIRTGFGEDLSWDDLCYVRAPGFVARSHQHPLWRKRQPDVIGDCRSLCEGAPRLPYRDAGRRALVSYRGTDAVFILNSNKML